PASLFIDADTNVIVPGLLARPEVRRPFAWDTYVYDPYAGTSPPPSSSAGTGPYGDLTNPAYYGQNPYEEGFRPNPPPRAYTFERTDSPGPPTVAGPIPTRPRGR